MIDSRFARIGLIAALVLPAASGAQDVQFKVQSRLVLVDLIVTDQNGKFVSDLKKEEIEVSEDGKRREIPFLDLIGSEPSPTAGLPAQTRGVAASPSEVVAAAARPSGATMIFVLDLHSISAQNLPQVKETIADFARANITPDDRLMLATCRDGLQIRQPPTGDIDEFLRVLEPITAKEDASSRLLRFGEELDLLLTQLKAGDLKESFILRYAIGLGRSFIQREESDERSVYKSLASFMDNIGTLPGRKNVVFFSGGYRPKIAMVVQDALLHFLGGTQMSHGDSSGLQIRSMLGTTASAEKLESYLRDMVETANRRQVSFYTIDARALLTGEDIRFKSSSAFSETLKREEIKQPQGYLRDLASLTGGRWFLNSNDLELGLDRALEDSRRYYELGYVPEGKPEPGKLHKIKVKVLRPDLTVSYRESYVEPKPYDPLTRALENAFKFPALFHDFDIDANAEVSGGELKVDVFVPTRTLQFIPSGTRRRCELRVNMALFDSSGGLVGERMWFSKSYNLNLDPKQFEKVKSYDNVTTSHKEKIPPGSYRLRIVVRQPLSSRTAALEKHITAGSGS